jgi:hypothetical protein
MDKLRKYAIYLLWIIGFFILSEFLINVGLNSTYKDMKRRDETPQVLVYQAEATAINGRIRGVVNNAQPEDLSGKYIKFEFFSKRNVSLGKKYIEIDKINENGMQPFELFFKLQNVSEYTVSIVDEKEEGVLEIEILPKDMTKQEMLVATLFTFLIFW